MHLGLPIQQTFLQLRSPAGDVISGAGSGRLFVGGSNRRCDVLGEAEDAGRLVDRQAEDGAGHLVDRQAEDAGHLVARQAEDGAGQLVYRDTGKCTRRVFRHRQLF